MDEKTALPEIQVDPELVNQLAEKLAAEKQLPERKPVGLQVTNDHLFVYLRVDGKPYSLTLLNARELALALRQACNRVERGQR